MALSSATLLSHLKKKPTVIFSLSLLLFLLSFLFLPSEPSLPFSRISTSDLSKVEPSVTGTGTGLPPPPLPADLDQTDVPPPSLDADLDPKEADDEKVESVGNGVEAPPPDPDPDPDPDPVEVETGGSGVEAASPDPVEVEMGGSGVEAPPPDPDPDGSGVSVEGRRRMCDLYQGRWVMDEEGRYPLYAAGSCPYVDDAYTCQENGRTDVDYMKWRWKPNDCHLPRFNATDFLERLRGKHLMLVGDSMNRNQFESMLCLLREALPDKRRMYETRGYKITKGRGYFIFLFKDYKCTVEFVRSHFLVREGTRINKQGNSNPTLAIDRIDKSANRWKKADILVFNTGHWWTHGKTARGKNYYVEGGVIYPQFDAIEAFRRALRTWGRWIDNNMNKKSLIFYRGYSAAHFRGGDWDSGGSCSGETEPAVSGAIIDSYPLKMKIVEDVIDKMKVPVVLLNVTKLTNFRKDAHPSIYGMLRKPGQKVSKRKQDCSHWCLPGVPDSWNELIYATLVLQQPHKA